MLTYEAKRAVLEAYLRSNLRHCDDDCCWVCDLDDNFVYFYFNDKHYSAPYVITEDALGNGVAVVNLESKQTVVHSWAVFSEDEKEDDKENKEDDKESFENQPAKPSDNSKSFDDDEDEDDDDEEHGEGHGEDDEDEKEDDDEDEEGEDDDDEEDDDEEGEEDDDEEGEDDDDSEENNPVIIESACGDKTTEACNPENKENEACNPEDKETEACNPEDKTTESATFSADNHQEFVMLDNEQLSINQLLDKYNELHQQFSELNEKYNDVNEKYSAIMAQEEEKNINSMINFGCSFIENESRLSDSDKKAFSEEVTEKCKNKYFENQDSLKKFVLTKIAVSLYNAEYESKNNPDNKPDTKTDFCVDIVKPTENHILSGIEKLKEANKKLNRI